jgi:hypothetical protein
MTPYHWVFERSALNALLALRTRQAQSLADRVDFLAAHPFHRGHLVYRDERRREIHVWLVDGFEIHYAHDHATRELRIAEIRPDSFTTNS